MISLALMLLLAPASGPTSKPTSGPTSKPATQPTSKPSASKASGVKGASPQAKLDPEAEPRFELEVVAVYRPLDLKGRFVEAPREVFLRLKQGPDDPKLLLGAPLEVRRRRPLKERADLPPSMDLRVARLEITQARGRVVVAKILEEELSEGLALKTIQVGDYAWGHPKPPPKPKKKRKRRRRKTKRQRRDQPTSMRRAKTVWEL